jgi:hypothetical protein
MDLEKAKKAKELLGELEVVKKESVKVSFCKGFVLHCKDVGYVDIAGTEIKSSAKLLTKFLEDVEKEVRVKEVDILEELTKL